MNTNTNQSKSSRHGTEKRDNKSTDSPPTISFGNHERELLRFLSSIKDRFNLRQYGFAISRPRSTVYGYLERLESKGLVSGKITGNWVITAKGKTVAEVSAGVSRVSEGGVGVRSLLSQHDNRYEVKIFGKKLFDNYDKEEILKRLGAYDYHPVHLPNRTDHIYKLSEATIIIKTHVLIIRVREITGSDVDNVSFQTINCALDVVSKLKKVGLELDNALTLDGAHYERMNSVFAEFLEKIDNRYCVQLANGETFWIDRSKGTINDEVNGEDVRKRIDSQIRAMSETDTTVLDIDKLHKVTGDLIKLRVLDTPVIQQIDRLQATTEKHILQSIKGQNIMNLQLMSFVNQMSQSVAPPETTYESDELPHYIG